MLRLLPRGHFVRACGLLAGLSLVISFSAEHNTVLAQRSTCGAAIETINWARERLVKPALTAGELNRVLSLLELSTQNCNTNGDLWYYRYLLEQKTGAAAEKISYSLQKATQWRSDALTRKANPFAPPPPAIVPAGPVVNKWALVVGVSQFVDSKVPPLDFTAKDATDLEKALIDPALGRFDRTRVRTLVDAQATLTKVREGIGWLRANAGPDDLAIVYVASHGSPRELDPNGVSYVLMHDTETGDAEHLYASALQMIDLAEDLSRDLRAGRVMLMLDTCYSGEATKLRLDGGVTAFAPALEGFSRTPGRMIVAAAGGDQESWESPTRKNGYFTFYLLDALRRSQGRWPLRQLFEDVRSSVTTTVQRELGKTQTPVMSGSKEMEDVPLGLAESTRQ